MRRFLLDMEYPTHVWRQGANLPVDGTCLRTEAIVGLIASKGCIVPRH